jgi:hypothetical protein
MSLSDSVGNFLAFRHGFKKLTCPWLTVTAVEFEKNRSRTLLVSVNQNKTGKKGRLI